MCCLSLCLSVSLFVAFSPALPPFLPPSARQNVHTCRSLPDNEQALLTNSHTRELTHDNEQIPLVDSKGDRVAQASLVLHTTRAISLLLTHPPSPRLSSVAPETAASTPAPAPPASISILPAESRGFGTGVEQEPRPGSRSGDGRGGGMVGTGETERGSAKVSEQLEAIFAHQDQVDAVVRCVCALASRLRLLGELCPCITLLQASPRIRGLCFIRSAALCGKL